MFLKSYLYLNVIQKYLYELLEKIINCKRNRKENKNFEKDKNFKRNKNLIATNIRSFY